MNVLSEVFETMVSNHDLEVDMREILIQEILDTCHTSGSITRAEYDTLWSKYLPKE